MTDDLHNDRGHGDAPRDEADEMDALDRLIVAAAQDYHRPPAAVPRDAMWEAIVASRGAGRGARNDPGDAAPVLTLHTSQGLAAEGAASRAERAPRRAPRAPSWLALAVAASLLLATGVGVGRWWGDRVAGAGQVAAVGATDSAPLAPAPRVAAAEPAPARPTADTPPTRDVELGGQDATAGDVPRVGRGRERALRDYAARDAEGAAGGPDDRTYDDAMARHFTAAEAMLVSFRSAPAPTGMLSDSVSVALDGRLAGWARQLLEDTRLLLDSPASADPRRRRLLEDLELVLAQITRLGAGESTRPSGGVAERELIDGKLKNGQVLSRLRTAIPSGTE